MHNMKRYLNIYLFIGAMALLSACNKEQDPMGIKQATAGSYLRTISVTSNTFNTGDLANSNFGLVGEEWDEEKGGLLDHVTFSVLLTDNSPDNGTLALDTAKVAEIPKSSFSVNSTSGLLRATVTITADETLAALGISGTDLGAGDKLRFLARIYLTDGRSFATQDIASGMQTSTYYKSPMYYDVSVQ